MAAPTSKKREFEITLPKGSRPHMALTGRKSRTLRRLARFDEMTDPQIPILYLPNRRNSRGKAYLFAAAVGVAAGVISFALALLRRS